MGSRAGALGAGLVVTGLVASGLLVAACASSSSTGSSNTSSGSGPAAGSVSALEAQYESVVDSLLRPVCRSSPATQPGQGSCTTARVTSSPTRTWSGTS